MGGRPLFALSLVAFPRERLESDLLPQIVSGGGAKLAEAGVPVIGGHSVDDPEPKFGYAVIGEVAPARMVTHQGAQPGDALILTKPLGSGIATTAIKRGLCPPNLMTEVIALMTHLNRDASAAMVECGAHAATDITGYGLLGHLANLEVSANVNMDAVPILDAVRGLAARGVVPGGTHRNREALAGRVDWGNASELDQLLLCDAQTSGGLLVALPEDRVDGFVTALAAGPYPAVRVGAVTASGGIRLVS